jgi:hypothetical protein
MDEPKVVFSILDVGSVQYSLLASFNGIIQSNLTNTPEFFKRVSQLKSYDKDKIVKLVQKLKEDAAAQKIAAEEESKKTQDALEEFDSGPGL